MAETTINQKQQYKETILRAISSIVEKSEDGWIKSINMGPIIKEAGIDYKSMGFMKLTLFLLDVFGSELQLRGEKLTLEMKFPNVSDSKGIYCNEDVAAVNKEDIPNIDVDREDSQTTSERTNYSNISDSRNTAYTRLLKFAFFSKPSTSKCKNGFVFAMQKLAEKALEERWYYGDTDPGDFPILRSYFIMTFDRLQHEDSKHENDSNWDKRIKVVPNENNTFGIPKYDKKTERTILSYPKEVALLNTGLVDRLYEPIYAIFYTNTYGIQPWRFYKFVSSSGDDNEHMFLAKLYGDKFPLPAKYYDSTLQLVYDITKPIASINWSHIVDNCKRLPLDFLEDNCPIDMIKSSKGPDGGIDFKMLAQKIKFNSQTYRRFQNRIQDAIDHSLKRVEWNFKTAIPIYFSTDTTISLLLPLSLSGETNKIDAALVLESDQTAYIAHTVYTLKMAYAHARLITRPDSDWLTTTTISFVSAVNDDIETEE